MRVAGVQDGIEKGGKMSVWSDNPEWFDEFFYNRAISGKYGTVAQGIAEREGEFDYYALEKINPDVAASESQEATVAFSERYVF